MSLYSVQCTTIVQVVLGQTVIQLIHRHVQYPGDLFQMNCLNRHLEHTQQLDEMQVNFPVKLPSLCRARFRIERRLLVYSIIITHAASNNAKENRDLATHCYESIVRQSPLPIAISILKTNRRTCFAANILQTEQESSRGGLNIYRPHRTTRHD